MAASRPEIADQSRATVRLLGVTVNAVAAFARVAEEVVIACGSRERRGGWNRGRRLVEGSRRQARLARIRRPERSRGRGWSGGRLVFRGWSRIGRRGGWRASRVRRWRAGRSRLRCWRGRGISGAEERPSAARKQDGGNHYRNKTGEQTGFHNGKSLASAGLIKDSSVVGRKTSYR